MEREDTCHRTCFSLQLDGVTIDNFQELKSFPELKENSVLKVVDEPYTTREARLHVQHLKSLLATFDPTPAYQGQECASLTHVTSVIGPELFEGGKNGKLASGSSLQPDGTLTPSNADHTPPSYLVPGTNVDPPIMHVFLNKDDSTSPSSCVKSIQYSSWNPPSSNRKLHGDLLYLEIKTLEDKDYCVTCCPRGFYVNQSTISSFNWKPASGIGGRPGVHHPVPTLVDLLNQVSPLFRRNFTQLLRKRAVRHPFERVPTSLQVYSWLAPIETATQPDSLRAEQSTFPWKINCDDHIPYQNRDWNEEVQATREMPNKQLIERIPRERAMYKVDCDFAQAAIQGAVNVIDGNIMPINPGETPHGQMFIWNNIFFSLGFEVKDHFKEFGGNAAAHVSPVNDLKGIHSFMQANQDPNLHTLATAVVDYRGYRVVAQSIVPGILEKEQEQLVVYGSYDFGKSVVADEKYHELLKGTCQTLKLRSHKLLNHNNETVEVYGSVDSKGITGNDKREYMIDLLSTMPPDINFRPDVTDRVQFSEKSAEAGFPRSHPHKLAQFRQEFIDNFVEEKYMEFVQFAASKLKQAENSEESAEEKQQHAKQVIKEACEHVESLSSTEFDITFNPDLFHPVAKCVDSEEEMEKQVKLLTKVADHMITRHIPNFVEEIAKFQIIPIDGITLTEHMHRQGINMRYLGEVLRHLEAKPAAKYAAEIATAEIITRSAKHVFRSYMQSVDPANLAAAVAHFLNCYFSTPGQNQTNVTGFEQPQNNRKKSKSKSNSLQGHNWEVYDGNWASERSQSIWKRIEERSRSYFAVEITCNSFQEASQVFGLRQMPMLRSFCKATGIQLATKDYFHRQNHSFRDDDIRNLYPVVRHTLSKASDPYQLLARSHALTARRMYREAIEILNEALTLFSNIYGAMHADICLCLKVMARLYYITLDFHEAVTCQHRVVVMTERLFGLDHPNVITEYTNFSLYCAAIGLMDESVRLMYRARYLSLLVHSERHPDIAIIDTTLGVLLLGLQDHEMSIRYFENALELFREFFGEKSDQFALCRHLMARVYAQRGDFKSAIAFEGVAYEHYKERYGNDDDRVKDSLRLRQVYTQQAVEFAKTIRDIRGDESPELPSKTSKNGKNSNNKTAKPRSTFFVSLNILKFDHFYFIIVFILYSCALLRSVPLSKC